MGRSYTKFSSSTLLTAPEKHRFSFLQAVTHRPQRNKLTRTERKKQVLPDPVMFNRSCPHRLLTGKCGWGAGGRRYWLGCRGNSNAGDSEQWSVPEHINSGYTWQLNIISLHIPDSNSGRKAPSESLWPKGWEGPQIFIWAPLLTSNQKVFLFLLCKNSLHGNL